MHELHRSKLPFVARIEFIRSNHSSFSVLMNRGLVFDCDAVPLFMGSILGRRRLAGICLARTIKKPVFG